MNVAQEEEREQGAHCVQIIDTLIHNHSKGRHLKITIGGSKWHLFLTTVFKG